MVSEDVETDAAVAVDVGVVDAGGEVDLGRLERVVCGEMDGEEKDTAGVWRVTLETCQLFCFCACRKWRRRQFLRRAFQSKGLKDLRDP